MNKIAIILLLLISTSVWGNKNIASDTLKSFLIEDIKISGNDITEDFIILRELTFSTGDSVSQKMLNFNRERVFSLGLFSNVDFVINDTTEVTVLNINIKESWYIYPVPFFHVRENSVSKSTYGINVLYKNFRGRNEKIRFVGALGYNPALVINYFNPVIDRENDINFQIDLRYGRFSNRSDRVKAVYGDDFEYKYSMAYVGFGKRFNRFVNASVTSGFRYVEPDVKGFPDIISSESNADRLPFTGISVSFDSRDLAQFPRSGIYAGLSVTHHGFGINNSSFNTAHFDFRNYHSLWRDLVFKWRTKIRNSSGGSIPVYELSYLGYDEFVRGYRSIKFEAHNYMITSAELTYPIIREWNFSIKLPYIPERLTRARIGLHFNLFSDIATTFYNNDNFFSRPFHKGYGLGLTLLFLPFNAMRFELGFDENNNGEFIFESGFSF